MEDVEEVLDFGLRKLGYSELREGQRKVVKAYISGKDVFFHSPTGSGKLLCFDIAPFVFEGIAVGVENAEKQASLSSVCNVVAPLVSLMKNQVADLRKHGITAAIIGPESNASELKDIRLGQFNLVFGSPETLLNSHRSVILARRSSFSYGFSPLFCQANLGIDDSFLSKTYFFQKCNVLVRAITANVRKVNNLSTRVL